MKLFFALLLLPFPALAQDAATLVKSAIDYWRGQSSYTEAEMIVHRPDWERRMRMRAWTSGDNHSLVRFTAPAKDAGNASLTISQETWSYNPKINKIIKIPSSMRSQSWMGSDFSYDDLSKADRIVRDYTHRAVGTEMHQGKKVTLVESIPHEDAAVPWGKETLKIREDKLILEHKFFDQDMKLIKSMQASEIKPLGGRLYASVMRMTKQEETNEWTEVHHFKAEFDLRVPANLFTTASLSNPAS